MRQQQIFAADVFDFLWFESSYMTLKLHKSQSVVLSSPATEVCFEGLGCFVDGPPWGGTAQRPVSALPSHPDEIGTRFLLFTQRNRYYQARKRSTDRKNSL